MSPFRPIVSIEEMSALERRAISAGVREEALMDAAGEAMAAVAAEWMGPKPGVAVIFVGKGHNGGDALVVADKLLSSGWTVELRLAFEQGGARELTMRRLDLLRQRADSAGAAGPVVSGGIFGRGRLSVADLESRSVPAGRPLLLVDGLLGIGAGGKPRGAVAAAVRTLNALREAKCARTLAVDLPSGLEGRADPDKTDGGGGNESGSGNSDEPTDSGETIVVVADLTVTVGWPKSVLFGDDAAGFVGRLAVVPLEGLEAFFESENNIGLDGAHPEQAGPGGFSTIGEPATVATDRPRDALVTLSGLRSLLPGRAGFSKHKGQSGRIGIVAGSLGLTGAARLSAGAAAAMGGGLVTLFCPREVQDILAAACPPEVMVRGVRSCAEVMDFPLDVLGVGPGMGAAPLPLLATLLREDPRPMVVDADALNALAGGAWQGKGPISEKGKRLLTPHPGELARLVKRMGADPQNGTRRRQARQLAEVSGAVVLAKSARSFVVEAKRGAAWNPTGHPLMARGGMGDVLTGFLATLAGQGVPFYEAAALGSWLLGRGAELYAAATGWEEPGVATEVMHWAAGQGMREIREGAP